MTHDDSVEGGSNSCRDAGRRARRAKKKHREGAQIPAIAGRSFVFVMDESKRYLGEDRLQGRVQILQ